VKSNGWPRSRPFPLLARRLTDATFYNWKHHYGEQKALEYMQNVFGVEYPKKGMVLAMGTHSLYPDTWLINGIIRLDEIKQMSLL